MHSCLHDLKHSKWWKYERNSPIEEIRSHGLGRSPSFLFGFGSTWTPPDTKRAFFDKLEVSTRIWRMRKGEWGCCCLKICTFTRFGMDAKRRWGNVGPGKSYHQERKKKKRLPEKKSRKWHLKTRWPVIKTLISFKSSFEPSEKTSPASTNNYSHTLVAKQRPLQLNQWSSIPQFEMFFPDPTQNALNSKLLLDFSVSSHLCYQTTWTERTTEK